MSIFRRPASISIKKESGSKFSFSANGACTEAGGMTISYDDPRYGDCIAQRSFAKKIIFDDPTKSIMMNINIDQFGFWNSPDYASLILDSIWFARSFLVSLISSGVIKKATSGCLGINLNRTISKKQNIVCTSR